MDDQYVADYAIVGRGNKQKGREALEEAARRVQAMYPNKSRADVMSMVNELNVTDRSIIVPPQYPWQDEVAANGTWERDSGRLSLGDYDQDTATHELLHAQGEAHTKVPGDIMNGGSERYSALAQLAGFGEYQTGKETDLQELGQHRSEIRRGAHRGRKPNPKWPNKEQFDAMFEELQNSPPRTR